MKIKIIKFNIEFTPTPTLVLRCFAKIFSKFNLDCKGECACGMAKICQRKTTLKSVMGFTLIEALVAISILMVAVVSPMTIAQKGLSSAMYSKDQMTAAFLAQDVIEYLKNRRDNIGLSGSATGNWLGDLSNCSSGCNIDTIKENINGANLGTPLKVERDTSGLLLYYNLVDGTESKFVRTTTITTPNNPDEALISVLVSWSPNSAVDGKQIEIKNYIYNYWENL